MESQSLLVPGRFVVMLGGRHAGKKAVVIASYPQGTEQRKFPYCVVLGLEKGPKKVTREMSQEVLVKRTQIKTFIKAVNFNHVLLTRHVVKDDDFWKKIDSKKIVEQMGDAATKKPLLTEVTQVLRQKYLNNKMSWFFKSLNF